MPDLPDPIRALEVAVVDPDVLWAVERANGLRPLYADTFSSVTEALDHLDPGAPAVVVLGPGLADEVTDALVALDAADPALSVVVEVPGVTAARAEALLDAGAEAVLGDDVDDDAVLSTVQEALAASRSADRRASVRPARPSTGASVGSDGGPAAAVRPARGPTVVLVTAAKGGEGVSTVAANLAAVLAEQGPRVALVDCDPNFGDLPLLLGLDAPPVVDDPGDLVPSALALRAAIATHEATGVHLAVLPRLRDDFTVLPEAGVAAVLEALDGVADVVILDAPFHAVVHGRYPAVADHVVVVTRPSLPSVKNAVIALDALGRPDGLSVVVNRVPPDGLRSRLRRDEPPLPDPDEVADALHHPVAAALPDDVGVLHLAGSGTLPAAEEPDGDFAAEVRRLASTVTAATAR